MEHSKWSNIYQKKLQFLPSLQQKTNSVLTESTHSDKYFEYLGKFNFVFKMDLGHDQGTRWVPLMKKKRNKKILSKCTFKVAIWTRNCVGFDKKPHNINGPLSLSEVGMRNFF
jgi:hypothetical protein